MVVSPEVGLALVLVVIDGAGVVAVSVQRQQVHHRCVKQKGLVREVRAGHSTATKPAPSVTVYARAAV